MTESVAAAGTALWLGILTSISPCPLATNIAAISFVGRKIGKSGLVLTTGLLYTLGRVLAYSLLGIIIVNSLLSTPALSFSLQRYMNQILGPLLILVGMLLLELISIKIPGLSSGPKLQARIERWGIIGAIPLGFIFALSFCPVSAALFFGSLIPLALRNSSGFALPSIYGIGTALPVIAFAVAIVISTKAVGNLFAWTTTIELWARRITGGLFVLIGIYFCLRYIFEVF